MTTYILIHVRDNQVRFAIDFQNRSNADWVFDRFVTDLDIEEVSAHDAEFGATLRFARNDTDTLSIIVRTV